MFVLLEVMASTAVIEQQLVDSVKLCMYIVTLSSTCNIVDLKIIIVELLSFKHSDTHHSLIKYRYFIIHLFAINLATRTI